MVKGIDICQNRRGLGSQNHNRVRAMSALPPKADVTAAQTNVRFVPKADILRCSEERRCSIASLAQSHFRPT